ncbi:MAG: glutamate 5-kinase, partial [Deltaproteobacteria bacterium]|nr:glutamate 5-kinase [Deltaproteobacteria bacterium]
MNAQEIRKNIVSHVRRVVVKLGSSVVTTDKGLDRRIIRGLADEICDYRERGKEFIIVSSGAVAAGVRRMDLKEGARTIPQKQAAAAVGQSRLMAAYDEAFS